MCQLRMRRKRPRSPSSTAETAPSHTRRTHALTDITNIDSTHSASKLRKLTPRTQQQPSTTDVHSSPLRSAHKVRVLSKLQPQECNDSAIDAAHEEQRVACIGTDERKSNVTNQHATSSERPTVTAAVVAEVATPQHRDEIVGAILTIASALGLARETLHLCVDVLDRYMDTQQTVAAARLETLSIACLWIAVKFIETPATIEDKAIKQILQQRRHSGNWTWREILDVETHVLQALDYRLMAPTTLGLLHKRIYARDNTLLLSTDKLHLASYFADLFLLKHRARAFSHAVLVDAITYVLSDAQLADVQASLLAPVVLLFVTHRDVIDPTHVGYRNAFALRCHYGARLVAPWRVPYDATCICRVCEHVQDAQETIDDRR